MRRATQDPGRFPDHRLALGVSGTSCNEKCRRICVFGAKGFRERKWCKATLGSPISLREPERLETILAAVLDRRQDRSQRQRTHISELTKRTTETKLRLRRLCDAIEEGVADLDGPALKERVEGLNAIRDQARADADRARAMLEHSGSQAITPQMLTRFSQTARNRMRLPGGGFRRDHRRALARRVEVAEARSGSSDRSPVCSRRSWRTAAHTQCPLRD